MSLVPKFVTKHHSAVHFTVTHHTNSMHHSLIFLKIQRVRKYLVCVKVRCRREHGDIEKVVARGMGKETLGHTLQGRATCSGAHAPQMVETQRNSEEATVVPQVEEHFLKRTRRKKVGRTRKSDEVWREIRMVTRCAKGSTKSSARMSGGRRTTCCARYIEALLPTQKKRCHLQRWQGDQRAFLLRRSRSSPIFFLKKEPMRPMAEGTYEFFRWPFDFALRTYASEASEMQYVSELCDIICVVVCSQNERRIVSSHRGSVWIRFSFSQSNHFWMFG